MTTSTGEPSALSEAEVKSLRIENREWSIELRRRMAALVKSRMANQITHEEYTARREAAKAERAECDRRMALLGR